MTLAAVPTAAVCVPAAPHPAVCRIVVQEAGGRAFGSGTLIDAREQYGLVVTNWHVVRDATGPIEVRFPNGFTSQARPLKLDETWDLAALVVWRPPAEPVPLASRPPNPGDRLTICGYGQGDYRAAAGRCTDYYSPEIGQPQELVELSVQARQGDSGGPIFNDKDELAGVLFGAGQGTTLGSFGGRVQRFLATLAPDIGVPRTGPPRLEGPGHGRPEARLASQAKPPKEQDPFVVAEAGQPTPTAATPAFVMPSEPRAPTLDPPPQHGLAVLAPTQRRELRSGPSPSLADRSAAPALVSARDPITRLDVGGWRSAPTTATEPFMPQTSAAAPSNAEPVDWRRDAQGLLAVIGLAALAAHALKAVA